MQEEFSDNVKFLPIVCFRGILELTSNQFIRSPTGVLVHFEDKFHPGRGPAILELFVLFPFASSIEVVHQYFGLTEFFLFGCLPEDLAWAHSLSIISFKF